MSAKLSKSELVALAVSKGLVKNKTEATKKTVKELADLVGLGAEDETCGNLTKEAIVEKFANRIALLNLSALEVDSMTREDLCQMLFPVDVPAFNPANCREYTKAQLIAYSARMAVPLGQDTGATALDADRACQLLQKAGQKSYNSVQDPSSRCKTHSQPPWIASRP